MTRGRLLAVSDLHVSDPENRAIVERLRPQSEQDWLLVAGDVGDTMADIEWTLRTLSSRFVRVVWAPGNHELWTPEPEQDPVQLRGEQRYQHLVELCRSLDVCTPEDPYPVWTGLGGPVTVAALFVLYDYTFRRADMSKMEALEVARGMGVAGRDEWYLHPDPYPTREDWCRARLAATQQRLAKRDPSLPTVLINHFPLMREQTQVLHRPEFAPWCGTIHTRNWHLRFNATAVVSGHLHTPGTTWHDGVRFEEVSLGYPREWRQRGGNPVLVRQILPTRAGR